MNFIYCVIRLISLKQGERMELSFILEVSVCLCVTDYIFIGMLRLACLKCMVRIMRANVDLAQGPCLC